MLCPCHGEPAYWQADGYWRCAVKKRAVARRVDQARRDVKTARQRERYDADPVYRIEKRLRDDARMRAATLKRKKEAHGALPD